MEATCTRLQCNTEQLLLLVYSVLLFLDFACVARAFNGLPQQREIAVVDPLLPQPFLHAKRSPDFERGT